MGKIVKMVLLILLHAATCHATHPDCLKASALLHARPADKLFPAKVEPSHVHRLRPGIYQLRLADGTWGHLRLDTGGDLHNTGFEVFAAHFFNSMGYPVPIPRTVELPPNLRTEIVRQERGHRSSLVKEMKTAAQKASLVPVFPGITGHDHIWQWTGRNARLEIEQLAMRAKAHQKAHSQLEPEEFHTLKELWASLESHARKGILADLQTLDPSTNYTERGFVAQFKARLASHRISKVEELDEMGFRQLPLHVRKQVAEAWAINCVLGITDFHNENWMIEDGHVTPLDLANKSRMFQQGQPELPDIYSPFSSTATVSKTAIAELTSLLSPELAERLRALTPAQILETAKASGFSVTGKQAIGMVERARLLLPKPL